MANGGSGFGGGFASGMAAGGSAAGGGGAGGGMMGGMGGGLPGMGGGGPPQSAPLQPGQPVQFQPMQQIQGAPQTPALLAATRNLQAANQIAAMQPQHHVGSGYGPPGLGVGNDSAAAGRAAGMASHGNGAAASAGAGGGYAPANLGSLQSQIGQDTAREQELQQMGVPQGSDNADTYFQTRDYVNNHPDYTPPAILQAANTLSNRSFPNE